MGNDGTGGERQFVWPHDRGIWIWFNGVGMGVLFLDNTCCFVLLQT